MSVTPVGNLSYCKGLWSVISGTTCRCDKELVEDEIKNATELLRDGLSYFKKNPYTEQSLQSFNKTNPLPKMYDLISKLAPLLNLDATITWDLVCNFMLYEYRNCAETFASQLTDLTSMRALIEQIWSFYYTERITLIKCLKLMVEYRENEKHPHRSHFLKFFDEVLLGNLLESIRKQIEDLKFINPPIRSQLFNDEHLHQLYNRSLTEIRELLHIFTIILHEVHVAENQFINIYGSISGEPRRLISAKNHEDKEAVAKKIQDIQYSQTALLIVGLDMMKHSGMEDWIKDVRNSMQDVLEHKCVRDSYPQDGPLLLAWMVANYTVEIDNIDAFNHYRFFGIRAIQLNVFYYLRGLLNSEMIKEKTQYAVTVRGSIYNLFSLLCTFIDEDKFDTLPGIFDVCAALLSFPEAAKRLWQEKDDESGLWPIIKYAIQWFPYRFEPLTNIMTGLASASSSSAVKTIEVLENLPSITLEIPRRAFNSESVRQPFEKECVLHHNSYTIPVSSTFVKLNAMQRNVVREECEVLMFKTKADYWNAFHHKIEMLLQEASGGIANLSESNSQLSDHVELGFGLLEALLAADVDISVSMVIPTELSFEVINRFSYPVLPLNIYKVVAACIKISSKLVLRYPEDVLSRMRAGVYPHFDDCYQKTTEFAQAVSFDGGLVASWLSSIETIQHAYPILDAYLDTLSNYLVARHSKEALYTVEIPGMIMLLQSVLPKLDSWYFNSETERVELWLKSVYCLHRALDVTPGKKDESRSELRRIVTYNLLHLEPRHALLKLVRTGEKSLKNRMMSETDWVAGKGFKVMKSVQLALSVVNRLLMYRKKLGLGTDERSPLETALYASPSLPNALLIVPTIVDYLYVWFSPALQAMAVRLLKKFAEGFSMSLLVCMGMDGTAIRETFASRLMSPTCSAEVKVAILELVTVCLDKQPGLTEALFNIMHQAERRRIFPRPADEFLTEGCTRFLDLYLDRVRKEEDIVYDRLYDSTMNLLRAMWYHQNEILVSFFRKRPSFWSKLFAPLFRSLVPQVGGYSQLLDIITLEIFKSPLLEKDFTDNLEKLLDQGQAYWNQLTSYIFDIIPPPPTEEQQQQEIKDDEEQVISEREVGLKPLYESNLEAWYQLLVVLTGDRMSRNCSISTEQAQLTTSRVLSQLLIRLRQLPPASMRSRKAAAKLTMLLASISLRCVTSWGDKCIGSQNPAGQVKDQLVESMQEIAQSYRGYGKSLRQTLVALCLSWIELVEDKLVEDEAMIEYLLSQACILAAGDIEELREAALTRDRRRKPNLETEEEVKREAEEASAVCECIPATLTICLVTRLLRFKIEQISKDDRKKKSPSLPLRQLVPELLMCVGLTLPKHPYMKFSKAALTLLSAIARSFYQAIPVDDEAIAKLWLALIPPKDIKNSLQDSLYEDCPSSTSRWRCQEWWPLYTGGLEFVSSLVLGQGHVGAVVMYLGSHEHLLTEASTLLRHTADPLAADLIQSLVNLISALSVRPIFWESLHPSVRETLIKCTYFSYDSTVNLLLRPRILKFIIDGISVESAEELQSCDERQLSGELRLLVNRLILINTSCAQSFVRFSPRLNALVDTINAQEDFWYAPMAEMNFGPPQMSMTSGPRLTYGTIISSTQLFTQAQWHTLLSSSGSSAANMSLSIVSQQDQSRKDRDKDQDRDPEPSTSTGRTIDSARHEWERATPENLRRMQTKDLRKILYSTSTSLGPSVLASASSTARLDFSSYLSGHDLTVPLLSAPKLIKRPFDPLICENMILSRATALVPLSGRSGGSHVSRGSSPGAQATSANGTSRSPSRDGTSSASNGARSDPWFASMEENNTRLALEVNLVLILCQAFEGVRSPRLAVRDRQLIVRETATELSIFFDFLEHRGQQMDWQVAAALVDPDVKRTTIVKAPEELDEKSPARFVEGTTVQKVPMVSFDDFAMNTTSAAQPERETRSSDDVVSTGGFNVKVDMTKFLPLLGRLLKSVVESLDSAQFG